MMIIPHGHGHDDDILVKGDWGNITIIFIPNKKMTKYLKKTKKKYVNNTSGLLTMRCSFDIFTFKIRFNSE